jgi:hypothetical protein
VVRTAATGVHHGAGRSAGRADGVCAGRRRQRLCGVREHRSPPCTHRPCTCKHAHTHAPALCCLQVDAQRSPVAARCRAL